MYPNAPLQPGNPSRPKSWFTVGLTTGTAAMALLAPRSTEVSIDKEALDREIQKTIGDQIAAHTKEHVQQLFHEEDFVHGINAATEKITQLETTALASLKRDDYGSFNWARNEVLSYAFALAELVNELSPQHGMEITKGDTNLSAEILLEEKRAYTTQFEMHLKAGTGDIESLIQLRNTAIEAWKNLEKQDPRKSDKAREV